MTKSKRQAPREQEREERMFDAMRHYVRQRERMAPAVFVGRDDILADLMDAVETTAIADDPKGMTRVVQGVPGAGKTATCDEFISRRQNEEITWTDEAGRKRRAAVFCVRVGPGALNAPPLTFVQELHGKWQQHCRSLEAGVTQAGRAHLNRLSDIVRLWCKRSTEHESVEKTSALTVHSSLDACIGAYSHDYWGDDMVIALCIDEAQRCPVTDHAKDILGGLHNREHPARIVPLLFGLPNTLDHVSDQRHGLGLSRLNVDCAHDICLLEPGQAREIVEGTFDKLGLEWTSPGWSGYLRRRDFSPIQWDGWRSQITDAIAEGSADFPQHVTLGLHAACQALIDRRETLAPAGLEDLLKDIRAKHQQRKTSYYQDRLGSITKYGPAFGAICRKAAGGPQGSVAEEDAAAAIEAVSQAEGMGADMLQQAVDKGVLRKLRNSRIAPPAIPSMSLYLDGVLQDALDMNEKPAARACQAIDLPAPPTETPATST